MIESYSRSDTESARVSAERRAAIYEGFVDVDVSQLKNRGKMLQRRRNGSKRRGGRLQHRWSAPKREEGEKGS